MTLVAGRIVQADAEIRLWKRSQDASRFFPRSQQIAEGNQAEVADQRCAQYSSAPEHAAVMPGDNLDFNFRDDPWQPGT